MTFPVIRAAIVSVGLALASVAGIPESRVCYATGDADAAAQTTESAGRPVLPTGWRRTTRGWERAENWGTGSLAFGFEPISGNMYRSRFAAVGGTQPQSVGQWMIWDRAREPDWVNTLFGQLKRIHPLFIAVFLIASALLITRISETENSEMPIRRSPQ